MKPSLANSYAAKMRKPKGCSACMAAGGKCMAHGGMVENPELDETHASVQMAPHEMVDADLPSSESSSMEERDEPQMSESLSLASEVMKDRKRLKMARGGMVNDQDEMDAPKEDGRESRGLNTEPVHTMEDDEHDVSDASLVAQVMRERRKRRMDE